MEQAPTDRPGFVNGPDDGSAAILRNSSGIWSLDGDRLASVEDFAEGPAVVLVPSEHVLLLAVDLPPIANAAKRRQAAPFAVEDRIAQPLEEVHVALGDELKPGRWLIGVVRHDMMRQWVARLERAELTHAALVPDCLSLPRPAGNSWSVDLAAGRAMVRPADGTGFAVPLQLLERSWRSAGEPECVAFGDELPPPMHAPALELQAEPLAERLLLPALDLRQGIYAAPRRRVDALWKRAATVAALGALAHAGIAIADTLALRDIAEQREQEVRQLAQNRQPPVILGPDLSTTAGTLEAQALAEEASGGVATPGMFLPLLTRAGGALAAAGPAITWRSLGYDGSGQILTVEVEASDAATLQRAASALQDAGLQVTPGAPVDGGMGSIASFAVRGQ